MNATRYTLKITSDHSAMEQAVKKLSLIADTLPVTVANFVTGAGGIAKLMTHSIGLENLGIVTLFSRPTDALQRFLDIFEDDDLGTSGTLADCKSRFIGAPLSYAGFPKTEPAEAEAAAGKPVDDPVKSEEELLTGQQNRLIAETVCGIAPDKTPDRLATIRRALITECGEINRQTLPSSLARLHKSL
jgi:hypothetical protein